MEIPCGYRIPMINVIVINRVSASECHEGAAKEKESEGQLIVGE